MNLFGRLLTKKISSGRVKSRRSRQGHSGNDNCQIMKMETLESRVVLSCSCSGVGGTTTLLSTNANPGNSAQYGDHVVANEMFVVVGAQNEDTASTTNSGVVYVYDATSTSTTPLFVIENPQGNSNGLFGSDIAIDGTNLVVGARGTGKAYLYDLSGPTLNGPVVISKPSGIQGQFGDSVAISGNKIIVGDFASDFSNRGAAYVYELTVDTNTLQQQVTHRLTINNPGDNSVQFSRQNLAISGDTLVIGAFNQVTNGTSGVQRGRVYVYDLNFNPYVATLTNTINNPNIGSSDNFGFTLDIDGDTLAVGAQTNSTLGSEVGQVHIYDLAGSTVAPVLTINHPEPTIGGRFGSDLALSGRMLAVSARLADPNSVTDAGRAYLFDLDSATPGTPTSIFENPTPAAFDTFGTAIDLTGDLVVIGAPTDDTRNDLGETTNVNDGAAYIFGFGSVNNPPTLGDDSFTIEENRSSGTVVGTVVGSDVDVDNVLTYSITGGNTAGAFAIDAMTGEITVANAAAIDFETNPSFTLAVQVEDQCGEFDTADVMIDLTNLETSLTIDDVTLVEGDSGIVNAIFTVTSTDRIDAGFGVEFATADGSASFADYVAQSGTLNFLGQAGETQTITIEITPEDLAEMDEDFFVNLFNLTGSNDVTIADASGLGTIVNEDYVPVSDAGGPYEISEGDDLTLDALASTDADSASLSYRWDVDGDGDYDENITGATPTLSNAQLAALGLNDGPQSVTVTVEVSDGTNVSTAQTTLTINNIAPNITTLNSSNSDLEDISESGYVTLDGSFFDPALNADTHTVMVDWGDGSAIESISVDQLNDSFAGGHQYAAGGIYTILVTAIDEDGGTSSTLTTQAIVQGINVVDGELFIIGSDGSDLVFVTKYGGSYHILTCFEGSGVSYTTESTSGIDSLTILTGGENDLVKVDTRVKTPTLIDGGSGNDLLSGGGGMTVILGGSGNDMLYGNNGNDILIGGLGNDLVSGGSGQDILIGGTTNLDNDYAALMLLLDTWNGSESFSDRITLVEAELEVTDDGELDLLIDFQGRDLFFDGMNDLLLGARNSDEVV
ncbi:cadherin domain-containing protein [uncultured Rubinisphaera sp.]|uniref:cadherin domain-containing protein n=1 Tax=uncultured Rubinisphaera sp. TaxID=1678686 RepID=UPI0030D73D4C